MNSREMLQSYCERNGLEAGDLAEKGLQIHFEGGLSAHLLGDTRTSIRYVVDVVDADEAGDRDAVIRACLEANTALMSERTAIMTLDSNTNRVILTGRLECAELEPDAFEGKLEDVLDEAERLMTLAAARQ